MQVCVGGQGRGGASGEGAKIPRINHNRDIPKGWKLQKPRSQHPRSTSTKYNGTYKIRASGNDSPRESGAQPIVLCVLLRVSRQDKACTTGGTLIGLTVLPVCLSQYCCCCYCCCCFASITRYQAIPLHIHRHNIAILESLRKYNIFICEKISRFLVYSYYQ